MTFVDKRLKTASLLLTVLILTSLTGCTSTGGGADGNAGRRAELTRPGDLIVPGRTTKVEVRRALGEAAETVSDPQSGDEVWVFTERFEVPLAISLIPLVGDVADVVELAQAAQTQHELVVMFDRHGTVKWYDLRVLDAP
jgi:hypothetical protein